jgi:hypothetical protein
MAFVASVLVRVRDTEIVHQAHAGDWTSLKQMDGRTLF